MIRWIFAAPFIVLFGWISIAYVFGMIESRKSRKGFSFIPLVGGISGVIGLAILDWRWALYWFWVPLLLD